MESIYAALGLPNKFHTPSQESKALKSPDAQCDPRPAVWPPLGAGTTDYWSRKWCLTRSHTPTPTSTPVTHVHSTVGEALLLMASNSLQLTCCHPGQLLSPHTGLINFSKHIFHFPTPSTGSCQPLHLEDASSSAHLENLAYIEEPAQTLPFKGAPSYHSLPLPEVRTLIAVGFITHEVLSTLSCILVAHIFIKGWHYAMVYRTSEVQIYTSLLPNCGTQQMLNPLGPHFPHL